MKTLQQILIESAATLDLTAELPSGTELTTRTSFANQAISEASDKGILPEFKEPVTTYATAATISLGSNFREFLDTPREYLGANSYREYPLITPEEAKDYRSTDRYCYVTGNPQSGYVAYFNYLTLNATLSFTKYRYPSGMATLSSICELSDPQYVVLKVNSLVLKARGDERFPILESEAEARLRNMYARAQRRPLGAGQQVRRTASASYSIS